MQEIRFDDIQALEATISEEFGPWGAETLVDQKMIDDFAEITGDRQWIHIDVERAKRESPFRTPIAHGFLTLSLLPSLNPGRTYKIVGYPFGGSFVERPRFAQGIRGGCRCSRLWRSTATQRGSYLRQPDAAFAAGFRDP